MDFLTLPQTPSLSGVGKGRGAPASRLVPLCGREAHSGTVGVCECVCECVCVQLPTSKMHLTQDLTESFPGEVRFREGVPPKLMGQRL